MLGILVGNILLSCLSCGSQRSKDRYIDPSIDTDGNNIPINASQYYFPMDFFTRDFLFGVDDPNLQNDLDSSNISAGLRQKLEERSNYRPVTVVVEEKGSKWSIVGERELSASQIAGSEKALRACSDIALKQRGLQWIRECREGKREPILVRRFPVRKEKGRLNIYKESSDNAWYSAFLFALREPLLFNKRENKEIYRFAWLRTFHNPIAVRTERSKDKHTVIWKLSNGITRISPGILAESGQKEIAEGDWYEFTQLLEKTSFWNMPTEEMGRGIMLDGATWILEGTDNIRYHVVRRWSPKNNDYSRCCDYLISLTDLEIDRKY